MVNRSVRNSRLRWYLQKKGKTIIEYLLKERKNSYETMGASLIQRRFQSYSSLQTPSCRWTGGK